MKQPTSISGSLSFTFLMGESVRSRFTQDHVESWTKIAVNLSFRGSFANKSHCQVSKESNENPPFRGPFRVAYTQRLQWQHSQMHRARTDSHLDHWLTRQLSGHPAVNRKDNWSSHSSLPSRPGLSVPHVVSCLSGFYLNDGSLTGFLWFRITALRDCFKKKLAPLFHPIRKPKQIVICSHTFYRASRQLCNNEFWLVHLTVRIFWDWLE